MSRLWVDANIVLRFITKEPQDMAEQAARLMSQAERGEVSLYIAPLVLAEMVWVLKSFYQYTMAEIAAVLIPLVTATGIEVEDRELAIRALELSRDQNVDYVDAYLAHHKNSKNRGQTGVLIIGMPHTARQSGEAAESAVAPDGA